VKLEEGGRVDGHLHMGAGIQQREGGAGQAGDKSRSPQPAAS
jgi:hypothetical protein